MEEVFDKIKEHANKAKDSAVQVTKTVIEKTNNIVNQTKLKFSISETKSKIKDIYTEIGKSVYENYKSTGEVIDDMEEKFGKIDAMTEEVNELKEQLYQLKENVKCPKCGAYNHSDDVYCSKCGERIYNVNSDDTDSYDDDEVVIINEHKATSHTASCKLNLKKSEGRKRMYQVWSNFLNPGQIAMLGIVVTFLLTFLALKHPFSFLPSDHGREFAVNGGLSRGKLRGVGLVIVICFLIGSVLFLPLGAEYAIYAILLVCIMLSGYLDDASETPWSDYKKGAIDLVISIVTVITFVNYNSTTIYFGSMSLTIPKVVYIILGIILIWISINVTNCSDGVDGLCASLSCVVIFAFSMIFHDALGSFTVANYLFVAALLAYLYFNTSPSSMLMGDAGSRALGFYIAILAMQSRHPFLYLLMAGVMIVDGGIGLVKVFLLRFLKIAILKNTRTPLHDHVRLKYKWSDSQVVIRFVILQILLAVVAYLIVV